MSAEKGPISLIPYLQPQPPCIRLEFTFRSQEHSLLEKLPNPFHVMDNSDPLATIYKGGVVSDSGDLIREIILYVQKDQYTGPVSPILPLTNVDLETYWQNTFESFLAAQSRKNFITLSGLVSKQGRLLPCKSLFFCKKQQVYFHPPCPKCGSELDLCKDDNILATNGLPPYSSSLQRFLYCPSCYVREGGSAFYVHEHGPHDRPEVQDRIQLIMSFSELFHESFEGIPLPCLKCTYSEECFGPEKLALGRIFPLSFYPFYLNIFSAPVIHCLDFLYLISGASFQEIADSLTLAPDSLRAAQLQDISKKGEEKLPFLYGDENHFLEVLFLKLSFLSQLIDFLASFDLAQVSFGGNLLDRIWVDLPESDRVLPYFWNFKIRPLSTQGISEAGTALFGNYANSALFSLAVAWFHVLLVNKDQDIVTVWSKIENLIQNENVADQESFINFLQEQGPSFVSLENVFWTPHTLHGPEQFFLLWEKALAMGWHLIELLLKGEAKTWSIKPFLNDIKQLTDTIRNQLLSPQAPSVSVEVTDEDAAIGQIIFRILEKWKQKAQEQESISEELETQKEELVPEQPPSTPESVEQEEIQLEKTVIVSHETFKEETPISDTKATSTEPEIPETVIISGVPPITDEKPVAKKPSKGKQKPLEDEDKEFEKTLSMLDEELIGLVEDTPEEHPPAPQQDDEIAPESTGTKGGARTSEDDLVPETIIIKPDQK